MSTCNNKTSQFLLAMNEKQEGRRGRQKENIVALPTKIKRVYRFESDG
jgi:hypothetical protein